VSPLVKYYLAMVGALCGLLSASLTFAFGPKPPVVYVLGLFEFGLFCLLFTQFVRCPRCQWRLAAAKGKGTHGLPGRKCPKCGCDLTRG